MNPSSLPAPGSHFISLTRGIEMTSLYRTQKENILVPALHYKGILPVCETFNRSDVDTLLAKSGCEAVRIYLGMDETLKVRMLIVAVNQNAEDILPSRIGPSVQQDQDIVEEGSRCPDSCPPSSPLNS
jgi:hypothetical protein